MSLELDAEEEIKGSKDQDQFRKVNCAGFTPVFFRSLSGILTVREAGVRGRRCSAEGGLQRLLCQGCESLVGGDGPE